MDKISVVVPVYNGELYIGECIESIQKQTYKNIEIIIIDDGSYDRTSNIVNEYKKNDNRIKYYFKKNSGPGESRNLGIKKSVGKYITFVDSDDFIEYDMIESLYKSIIDNQSDVVISKIYITYDRKFSEFKHSYKSIDYSGKNLAKLMLESNSKEGFTFTPGKLYKRDLLVEKKLYFKSIRYCEDTIFNLNVYLNSNKITYIEKEFYYYFVNMDSLTQRYDEYMDKKLLMVLQQLEDDISKYNMKESLDNEFNIYITNSINNLIYNEFKNKILLKDIVKNIKNSKTLRMYKINIIHCQTNSIKQKIIQQAIKLNLLDVYLILYSIYQNIRN